LKKEEKPKERKRKRQIKSRRGEILLNPSQNY